MNEYARVLVQPGKPFRGERVAALSATYRERVRGNTKITHLWLVPKSAQVTLGLSVHTGLFAKKEEVVPLSAGALLAPTAASGVVELEARMPVFCTDEHEQKARYRVGQFEGLTVAARTGLANGLLVRVRAHPEEEVNSPSDPLAPLVSVAGRRLILPPNWVIGVEQGGVVISGFPAQVASGVEYLDDLQVRERLWAILNENPALQPYLTALKVEVRDGVVYLGGRLPMARLRNSARQDIWHVPGVVAIEDTLRVEGE